MPRPSQSIVLTARQKEALTKMKTSKTIERRYHERALILLEADAGKNNKTLSDDMRLDRETIRHWRKKWHNHQDRLNALEAETDNRVYANALRNILSDAQRPGHPSFFTAEQVCHILSLACESPEHSAYPVSHWSHALLREEIIKRGIVPRISVTQVGRFLKSGRPQAA